DGIFEEGLGRLLAERAPIHDDSRPLGGHIDAHFLHARKFAEPALAARDAPSAAQPVAGAREHIIRRAALYARVNPRITRAASRPFGKRLDAATCPFDRFFDALGR